MSKRPQGPGNNGAGIELDPGHISRVQRDVAEGNSEKTLSGKAAKKVVSPACAGNGAAGPMQPFEKPPSPGQPK